MRLQFQTQPECLHAARRQLLESGEIAPGLIDEALLRSWQRSRRAGLLPQQRPPESALYEGAQLRAALDAQHEFLAHSRPVLSFLYDQMRDSGSLVVLADHEGLLLHSVGDPDFVSRADRVALKPGALWAESERGTNAIGTALAERAAVVIHGGEHFLERNGFLTCAAAPVTDSAGRLLGVVDISGDHRGRHPHTFALVRSAARMIEHRLFDARHSQHIRLRLHPQAEGLGAVGEALVAVVEDGWIVGANSVAQEWLGLDASDIGAITVDEVFGRRIGTLLAAGARIDGGPARITLPRAQPGQGPLYLRAERISGLVIAAGAQRLDDGVREGPVDVQRTSSPGMPGIRTAKAESVAGLDERVTAARERAQRALAHGLPLLLQGESGSGKDVFAAELHACGPRPGRAFVAVNCAALPETLIESELFGYVGGAFTGARKEGAPGRIREADGGTLFLDEIGDMPLAMQARLLRVLQDRSVMPLGGGRAHAVDFLLICATHRNLREEVAAGRFREDLYYRINGMTVALPALRERRDFQRLVAGMLETLSPAGAPRVAAEVLQALAGHRWPGNLRELRNVLAAACAMLDAGEAEITWAHLPDDLRAELQGATAAAAPAQAGGAGKGLALAPELASLLEDADLRRLSFRTIEQVVQATGGNMSEAARRLGISRNTLYRRVNQGR